MQAATIAKAYLDALEAADVDKVLALFSVDATVVSPLYGERKATDFYPELFQDTSESRLTLRGVMEGQSTEPGMDLVSIWFHFDWVLSDGQPAPFDVVDVLEMDNETRLIHKLHIVYDTHNIRSSFEASKAS